MKLTARSRSYLQFWFFALIMSVVVFSQEGEAQDVDFNRDISPILEERCWSCHGGDDPESGLRLDRRPQMLKGGDTGLAAVVPGKPEKSFLIEVINHVDEGMAMPPDEEKLPAHEIELLTRWIKQGAKWPGQMDAVINEQSQHWSFQTVNRPQEPKLDGLESSNPS